MAFAVTAACVPSLASQTSLPPDSVIGTASLAGRVVRDGRPVPGTPVELHRVTPDASGQVASSVTDGTGTFHFELPQLGEAAFNVFFVTAEYLSVRHFGSPIHIEEADSMYVVEVYDTTSTLADPVRIARRDIVFLPQTNDSWEINDLISVWNPGTRALVAGTGMPTLEIALPEGAVDFQAGQADILPHEVAFMDGRILLLTPVIPGQRDLLIRYRLPALPAEAEVPVALPTDTFNLYVQQPSHLTSIEGLETAQMISVEGEQFLQYVAMNITPDRRILLGWRGGSPFDPVIAAVAVTVLFLVAGAWVAVRNRRPPSAA